MEIRPILSALMRSKVAMILIGLQVALTLAIVCNALFIINERLAHMARPSGMNEADTFWFGSNGFGGGETQEAALPGRPTERDGRDEVRRRPGSRDARRSADGYDVLPPELVLEHPRRLLPKAQRSAADCPSRI